MALFKILLSKTVPAVCTFYSLLLTNDGKELVWTQYRIDLYYLQISISNDFIFIYLRKYLKINKLKKMVKNNFSFDNLLLVSPMSFFN